MNATEVLVWMTTREAAAYLRVTVGYLANLRISGRGPSYAQPAGKKGKVYYSRDLLDAWVRAGTRSSTTEEQQHEESRKKLTA